MGKLTWKSHCKHLTKLIKLGNAARFFWCINILLLLQQGGKTDKCSNYAFMCVLFQACVVLWRRVCCVCSKRLCNCSENSWNFSDRCIFSSVKTKHNASFCTKRLQWLSQWSVWPWTLVFSSLKWESSAGVTGLRWGTDEGTGVTVLMNNLGLFTHSK